MRSPALGFLILAPGLLALAACGGDEETPADPDVPAAEAPAEDPTPEASVSVADGSCEPTSVTGTTLAGTAFEASTAVAGSLVDGAAYTLYLADFDLTLDSFSIISTPEVPEGGTLWTVFVTIFNAAPEDVVPIEVGTVVEAGRPFGELTYTVTVNESGTVAGSGAGEVGTLTITSVGEMFCGSLEYTDDEKSLSGTFQAATKPV